MIQLCSYSKVLNLKFKNYSTDLKNTVKLHFQKLFTNIFQNNVRMVISAEAMRATVKQKNTSWIVK